MKMPCNYKITTRTTEQCKLEDARVGDEIIHLWECARGYGVIYIYWMPSVSILAFYLLLIFLSVIVSLFPI